MNDQQQNRIKLALLVGWTRDEQWKGWVLHITEKQRDIVRDPDLLPDPFTDANDCDALIKHLNGQGYDVQCIHGHREPAVVRTIRTSDWDCEEWSGDDWKQGVCELALKVIDD